MTMFRVGPAGIPGSLKTDMNTVLNKKFGTTAQDYPPADWPADVNLLGPLPIIISTKAPIVSFADGADDVPVESGTFYVVPSQAGTGTPSPSNPRAISGYTGMTITKAGKNLIDDTSFISGLPSTSIGASINTITASTRYAYVNLPKGGVTLTISSRSDDTDLFNNILIYGYKDGFLYQYTNASPGTNKTVDFSACDYIRLAIGARTASYQVPLDLTGYGYLQIETGSTATAYSAFTSETLAVSWSDVAGTIYGGNLNITTGVLTSTKAADGTDLAEPVEYQLTAHPEFSTYYGNNNFYCDTGDSQLNYRADISLYINNH